MRDKLLKILSFVEAKIDFPEEDLPEENLKKIKQDSSNVLSEINKILNDQKVGEIIREGFKIAIVGPTNAGKSSLLNNLSNREVAIVSEIAGTTRDVVETHLNIDGYPVIISDTAGIRDSKDEIEKKGIRLSLKKAENADLKLVVVDAKNVDLRGFLKLYPIEEIVPPVKVAAVLAIVSASASALSGDLMPRLRIASFASIFILPALV